ncbi:MAG: DNA-binding protein WhiA [Bacillota bacterium]|nr:DNA-binding protein WhiA [Bacillota bacterium]
MSFSSQTKMQLAQINTANRCCQLAEFLALTKTDGTISINSTKGITLSIVTENVAVAKKIFKLTKLLFERPGEVTVYRKNRLKKNKIYSVEIPPQSGVDEIFVHLGLMDSQGRWQNGFREGFPEEALKKNCCKRAYIRGAFLGSGSVNNPEGSYHMEIVCSNTGHARSLQALLRDFDVNARICQRKSQYVLYLKDGEQIAEFLKLIGANQALFAYENERIRKELCNKVNRQENFDLANTDKIVNASLEQRKAIEKIAAAVGLKKLPPKLRQVAELRLENPQSSLGDLAEMLDPPISKSGVRHRLKKLQEMADKIE